MSSQPVNLSVVTDISPARQEFASVAQAARAAGDQMTAAGRQAQEAWARLSAATIEANSAHKAVKDTLKAISTGEVPLTTRVVNDLAVAQAEAAEVAKRQAAAQRELKAAMGESSAQMVSARQQATMLSGTLGLGLGRGMEQIISRTPALSGALNSMFPMVMAFGFYELTERVAEKLSEWISDAVIFTKEMKAAYAAELAFNKQLEDEAGKQKQYQREIFEQTHTQAQVKNQDLNDEKKHLEEINAAIRANRAAQAETGTRAAREATTTTRNVVTGVVAAPGVASPETVAQAQKLRTEAELLNAQLATSKLRVQDLGNAYKDAAAQESDRAQRESAQGQRAAQQAQMQAWEMGLQQRKDAQHAFHTLSKQDEASYWADMYTQAKAGSANEAAALHNVIEAQKAADLEVFEAHKQVLENQIAASKSGSQQRVQMEQALADYVRSMWGEQSKQYLQAVHQRTEADRQWGDAQKEAAEKAARELREVNDLKAQGVRDEGLGKVAVKETRVKGQAETGQISPQQELEQLRALDAEKLEIERAYITAKLAIYAGDTKAVIKDKNEQIKLEAKAAQQQIQSDFAILHEREQKWREFTTNISHTLTTGLNGWIQGQKTFGQAMKQEWNNIAMSAIQSIEKIAENWIEQHIMMAAVQKLLGSDGSLEMQTAKNIAANVTMASSDAAAAAAATLAYYSLIAPEAAPELAAAQYSIGMTFAGLATFEHGGVVPKTQVAMVHGGERVLTETQNNMLERGLNQSNSTTNTRSGGDLHYHDNRKISALDGISTGRVLRRNSKQIVKELSRAMRMGKLGNL